MVDNCDKEIYLQFFQRYKTIKNIRGKVANTAIFKRPESEQNTGNFRTYSHIQPESERNREILGHTAIEYELIFV